MKAGCMNDNLQFCSISPAEFMEFDSLLQRLNVNTICNSALCPNRPECFREHQVAFLILGNKCTRNCKFCGVMHDLPEQIDADEPERIVMAIAELGLKHAVITSVTRDDLPDGGALQFARVIDLIRQSLPDIKIEALIPDFNNNTEALDKVIAAKPDIINHNIECCKNAFKELRPQGNYDLSLNLLAYVKSKAPEITTKSGFMVGVGETEDDIKQTLNDLKDNNVDIITIGQYLMPTEKSFKIKKMYNKEEFEQIRSYAQKLRFKNAFIGYNVRSSYHAYAQSI